MLSTFWRRLISPLRPWWEPWITHYPEPGIRNGHPRKTYFCFWAFGHQKGEVALDNDSDDWRSEYNQFLNQLFGTPITQTLDQIIKRMAWGKICFVSEDCLSESCVQCVDDTRHFEPLDFSFSHLNSYFNMVHCSFNPTAIRFCIGNLVEIRGYQVNN